MISALIVVSLFGAAPDRPIEAGTLCPRPVVERVADARTHEALPEVRPNVWRAPAHRRVVYYPTGYFPSSGAGHLHRSYVVSYRERRTRIHLRCEEHS